MTIAAGVLCTDGALLFSDSQFTGWEKTYKAKIFSQNIGVASIVFVMSGDEDYSRTAIDDSFEAAYKIPREQQSLWSFRKTIRRSFNRVREEYKKSDRDANQRPELILCLATREEGIKLFCLSDSACPEVDWFDFRGSGNYLAKYIMRSFGPTMMTTIADTIPVALHIISATKIHDSSVGGGSQFQSVRIANYGSNRGIG